jgi:hypothetical protein
MVSTPNSPGGLMESIENEPSDKCLYKRIKLDYRYGLGKIYTAEEIEKAKQSPSFDREYDLKYLGKIGNLYSQLSIDKAIDRGRQYEPDSVNANSEKYLILDPAWSSSKFGIIVAEWNRQHKQIRILFADELINSSYDEALDQIFQLRRQYGNVLNMGVDASALEVIMSLKKKIGERYDWTYVQEKLQYCKKHGLDPATRMIVVPIPFTLENKAFMASHSLRILDDPRGLIAINPRFTKLITALKAAQFNDRMILDKENSPNNDILDCFQMLSTFFHFKSNEER